ncbi:MAG: acetyl-CoA C-acyltransferase, partial [Alphaproteobacteria bacterium]|nr:acetyl-CoA C-acyltransferase [Alphaproteobacteria bacterium]
MREAVIVSTARTPIGRAYRGAFNNLDAPTMGGHAIRAAVERAGLEAGAIEDCIMGAALQQGSTGFNIGRQAALAAGLPTSVSGMSIDRQCSSGMMAIATAAKQVIDDHMGPIVAGGLEQISLVQNDHANQFRAVDPRLQDMHPHLHMPMIDTAETVAKRYGVARDVQDAYGLQSQMRTAAAQQAGRFDDEIIPVAADKIVVNRETGEQSIEPVTLAKDEGNRPDTNLDGLAGLKPVRPGGVITAGNASQLSDGAAALVVMEAGEAARRGLEPLGALRGFAVAGVAPEEMGIGPVVAIPRLLERSGMTMAEIDLWEVNEAFAAQLVHCRDTLGIPSERLNVSGGAISIGHPY